MNLKKEVGINHCYYVTKVGKQDVARLWRTSQLWLIYVANHYLPPKLGTIQILVKSTRLYPYFGFCYINLHFPAKVEIKYCKFY